MTISEKLNNILIVKVNVKSALLALSFFLACAGVYMCMKQFQATGIIDIKSAFVSGKISAGSLGLMVLFLAIFPAYLAHRISLKEKSIELRDGELRIIGKNMDGNEVRTIKEYIERHDDYENRENSSLNSPDNKEKKN